MNTAAYYLGYTTGFEAGRTYAAGTKADRARVRRLAAKGSESYAQFWTGFRAGLADLVEQRCESIRRGTAPRTIRPSKLAALLRG